MQDNHYILAHVQADLPGSRRQPGPLVTRQSHEWSQQDDPGQCYADGKLNNGASRPGQTASYPAPTPQPPTSATLKPTSRPNSLNDISLPVQQVRLSHGTDYFEHPPMRPEYRTAPQGAYHYSHSLPVHPQYHLQTFPAQYSPDMLAYDRQALQAKQDAILAAAHEYASTASRVAAMEPSDAGNTYSPAPPPSCYEAANSAFPTHPGPYYYHHLHHHRHYHHYPPPPNPGYYGQPLQPPALHRQDSFASSVSRNSEISGSTASHPSSTDLNTQEYSRDGNGQDALALHAAQSHFEVAAIGERDPGSGTAFAPGDVDNKEDDEGSKATWLSAEDQHRSAPKQSLYAGSSRTADSIRNRRNARSSTKPYPSVPSGRSASSSSACSSTVATPAASASQRTLRSSSSLAAKLKVENEGSADLSSSREAKPRASKTAAVSKLATVDSIYDPFDVPPTLEDSIKSLADRPTKKSRGRRAVLTEELNLENADSQGSGGSESGYAFASDGRAMPVTKEQLEFAGTTKTGRPRMIFICQVPGCAKCFRRAEHLRRHLEGIHSDVKPHVCDVSECKRAFARRDNLKQHMKAVHGRKDANDQIFTPAALTAEDIEEANAAFAGC